jgi:predicted outer membrane protein
MLEFWQKTTTPLDDGLELALTHLQIHFIARLQESHTMNIRFALAATALVAFTAVPTVKAADLSGLLNKANTINYEEVQMAKTAKDKAGDNQALITFADTLKGDHEANEEAVTALSRQKNVKIEGTPASVDQKDDAIDKLSGGSFNQAFLNDEVRDHEKALTYFKEARSSFRGDRDAEIYIEQTIPVLEAHLEMAKSLRRQMEMGSNENPENNKRQ